MQATEALEWIELAQRKWGEGADHKKRDEARALIVTAVNNHEALMELAELVASGNTEYDTLQSAARAVLAAVKKAKQPRIAET